MTRRATSTTTAHASAPTASSQSTSSAEGSPARTSRRRGSARASTTGRRAGSGESTCESFASYDRASSSWRTSPADSGDGSPEFSGTWPRSGSMRSGRLWPPTSPARRTGGCELSCWPTPTASTYGSNSGGAKPGPKRPSLDSLAKLWPTPLAAGHSNTAKGSSEAHHSGTSLMDAVHELWHTPRATDAKGTGSMGYASFAQPSLSDDMYSHHHVTRARGPDGMVLNPEFVEMLMGFPAAWSRSNAAPDSMPSATPLCRSKPCSPSIAWRRELLLDCARAGVSADRVREILELAA